MVALAWLWTLLCCGVQPWRSSDGPPLLCAYRASDREGASKLVCFESSTGSPLGDPLESLASPDSQAKSLALLRIQPPWPRPIRFTLAADGGHMAFVISREGRRPFVLAAYEVHRAYFQEAARVDLDGGLDPTALYGFTDGRVFIGYRNRVCFVNLQEGTQRVLLDLSDRRMSKPFDAFAWNGANLLVAVDDFSVPHWMVLFDVSARAEPQHLNTVRLANGVNDHYVDALFLDPGSLMLLSRFDHMGGFGSVLSFLSLDSSGRDFTRLDVSEFQDRDTGEDDTLVGAFSRMINLEKSSDNELVIAAGERGLLIVPRETQKECFRLADRDQVKHLLKSDVKVVRTAFPTVQVRCHQNMTVALEIQSLHMFPGRPDVKQFHISVYNREWEEVLAFEWPVTVADLQDDAKL
ncbi:unnamed protein product [Symbiodinium necroappetens]|uniref:Uncharacterized protein n=1 Tax=Symbiodinium necroappetens TaxID=1628268 RepID=A0A812LKX2_9DINO|nr:unnamed protein product [Symbiodinium necroappetens]